MGNRPVIEVTTGLAGEFLGLRYKSGSVVPRALDLTVWGGQRRREWNGMEWNGMDWLQEVKYLVSIHFVIYIGVLYSYYLHNIL